MEEEEKVCNAALAKQTKIITIKNWYPCFYGHRLVIQVAWVTEAGEFQI